MESTGDRIKKIRNALGLSQSEFGERIGVKKSAISGIETGRQSLASQMSHSVCREFHVSETWLETGEGEMFEKDEDFSLDQFLKDHDADQLEVQIVKAYFELPADMRRQLIASFKENLAREQSSSIGPLDDIDATMADIDRETEEYRRQLIEQKRAAGELPASDTGSAASGGSENVGA